MANKIIFNIQTGRSVIHGLNKADLIDVANISTRALKRHNEAVGREKERNEAIAKLKTAKPEDLGSLLEGLFGGAL